jgi:hypothetical protein
MKVLSIRSFSIAAALLTTTVAANALTIATNALVADSVQAFSQEALDSFSLYKVSITPLGNATAVSGVTGAFSFPITSITLSSSLKITSGDAKGSALQISRTSNGATIGLTVANFTIDYANSQVLADTTPIGGVTVKQAPLYTFVTQSALAIKYQFPLKITAHEVLGTLMLAPTAIDTMVSSLALSKIVGTAVLPTLDFGTLTQDIAVKLRAKAVSTKLYTPAQ